MQTSQETKRGRDLELVLKFLRQTLSDKKQSMASRGKAAVYIARLHGVELERQSCATS
jgi:hypothetical protein